MIMAAITGMHTMMSCTATMMEARSSHKPATGRPGRIGMLEREKPGLGDEECVCLRISRLRGLMENTEAGSATTGAARRFFTDYNMFSAIHSSCTLL